MKSIQLYNSLSKTIEKFIPLKEKRVSIYSCGPTVYKPPHIGNLRPYIFADTLNRMFCLNKYKVKHVINITDVGHLTSDGDMGEDKVEQEAKRNKMSVKKITEEITNMFFNDLSLLNIDTRKYIFPRASEYIKEQITIVRVLENKGFTYKISDGIYFDTSKLKEYAPFVPKKDNDSSYARIGVNEEKRNNNDFALWKFSKKNSNREQEWNSPWGTGFPGWHLECSAMSISILGERIDIHTGGTDHMQLHHNNEIAQSETYTDKKFVNYWLHSGFLTNDGKKISKSLGDNILLRNLSERNFNPLSFRYLVLQNKFSTPVSFSFESLISAEKSLVHINDVYNKLPNSFFTPLDKNIKRKVLDAINNNLNTAKVLDILWDVVKDNSITLRQKKQSIKYINKLLGILEVETKSEVSPEILQLAEKRSQLRKSKKFEAADVMRNEIHKLGFNIDDVDDEYVITKKKILG